MIKKIEITMLGESELSLDGQTRPAGKLHIQEYVNNELVGGSYATYENLVENCKEFFQGCK